MLYYRPVAMTDSARPPEALTLAGGWCWFDRVEVLSRSAAPRLIPAADLPDDWRRRLTAPRAPVCGLPMTRPQVMGILNVTPDSFSDGGDFLRPDTALSGARAMIADGAAMLDVGGESTRPGAAEVATDEEIRRTVPVIEALRRAGETVPISIDTRKAAVAAAALAAGADMVNDVTALGFDPAMAATAAGATLCLMHSIGTPATMQQDPQYENVLLDVYDFLSERIARAEAVGMSRDRILLDPGIGFGKTDVHNKELLRHLSLFHGLGCPLLLGVSRKRTIGKIGGATDPKARMPGSVAVALAGISQGVQMVRVHDIEPTLQAIRLWQWLAAPQESMTW